MTLLIFFIVLSVLVSFFCSMLEAVILSVTPSYLESLRNRSPKLYKRVASLKEDIETPLASILSFNTVAHTIGAAGAGAEAQRLFGNEVLAVFSAILTLIILIFSEIIPKSIGASRWRALLPFSVKLLRPMVVVSYPLVWMSQKLSKLIKGKEGATISREEISAIADVGLNEGVIADSEHRSLKNLLRFQKIQVKDILIQKEEVASLSYDMTLDDAYSSAMKVPFSRLVVFGRDQDDIRGYVMKNRLLETKIEGGETELGPLVEPILILPDDTLVHLLFGRLLDRKKHISAIVDESGTFLGIVTLEDLIETMLGLDIMDEFDPA